MLCRLCGSTTPSLFYKGVTTYCREHWKQKVRANRIAKVEHYREFDRLRGSMPHRVAARKQYASTPRGKARASAAKRAWEARNPSRKSATTAVHNALRDGLLQRLPCFVCGGPAEAHHPDYSHPLAVSWLCDQHHKQVHKEARAYQRG